MLPVAPATPRTSDAASEALLSTPILSRLLGAPIATTPPLRPSPSPSPPVAPAPVLTYSLWPAPKAAPSERRVAFIWPELETPSPWSAALTSDAPTNKDPFVRLPAVLPPDPLALARPRRAPRTTAPPCSITAPHSGPPQRPATRPEPLWPSPAPTPPKRRHPPHARGSAVPSTPAPALLTARPRLIPAHTEPAARPPLCVTCSLHPKLDAATRLLLQPQIVWSMQRDAARALHMLGSDTSGAEPTQAHRPRAIPHSDARACLWRGMARARLSSALAEADLQQAVREPALKRAALVHLLPVLIKAADTEPQSVARTRAEGYVNLALAQYPDAPYVRLCAALLAYRVGDVARSRQMLMTLMQSHTAYGPAVTVLAALDVESYANDHNPKTRAHALQLCKQNLALGQHCDMALSLVYALIGGGTDGKGMASTMEQITTRYGHALTGPEDVWALPLVVLDPALTLNAAAAQTQAEAAAPQPDCPAAPAPVATPGFSSKMS